MCPEIAKPSAGEPEEMSSAIMRATSHSVVFLVSAKFDVSINRRMTRARQVRRSGTPPVLT